MAVAGVQVPDSVQFDGQNMSEVMLGQSFGKRKQSVMWVRPPDVTGPDNEWPDLAIREGKWKLLVDTDGSGMKLYNLEENPGETINMVEDYPEVVFSLQAEVLDWFNTIISNTTGTVEPGK